MKSIIRKTATFAVAVAAAAIAARAGAFGQNLVVNVPFAFQTGNKTMEAGRYVIAEAPVGKSLTIRNIARPSQAMMTLVTLKNGAELAKGRLVFHRYGTMWFLRQVERPESTTAFVMPRTSREKEYERSTNHGPLEVAVVEVESAAGRTAGGAE